MLSAFVKVFAPVIKVVAKIIAPVVNVVNKVIQKVTGGQGTIAHIAQNVTNAVNTSAHHDSDDDDKTTQRRSTATGQTKSSNVTVTDVPTGTSKPDRAGDYTPMIWTTDQTQSSDGTGIFTHIPAASTGTNNSNAAVTATDSLLSPVLTTQTLSSADILKATGTLTTAQAEYDESFTNFVQSVPDRFQISLDRCAKEGWGVPVHTNAWSFLNVTFAPSVTKEEITDQAHSYFFDFKGAAATLDKVANDVAKLQINIGEGLLNLNPKPSAPPIDEEWMWWKKKEPGEYFPVMTEVPDWKKPPTGESNLLAKGGEYLINKIYNEEEEFKKFQEWAKTTPMGQAEEKARQAIKKFWNVVFSGAEEDDESNTPKHGAPTPEQLAWRLFAEANYKKLLNLPDNGIEPGLPHPSITYDPKTGRAIIGNAKVRVPSSLNGVFPGIVQFEDPNLKKEYPQGVYYTKIGFPDFTPYSEINVKIKMTDSPDDVTQANAKAGFTETPKGFTWHHSEDGETMMLVPSDLNNSKEVMHTGGAKIWRVINKLFGGQ